MRPAQFRSDLFYRLSEFIIVAPPLRQRPEDIEFLACRFLRQTQKVHETTAREFHRCPRPIAKLSMARKCATVTECGTARQPHGI